MGKHILNLGLRLMLICAVAAVGLGITYTIVEARIAEMERQRRADAATVVLASLDAQPQEDPELQASLLSQFPDLVTVFEGIDDSGNIVGYAFVVKSKGYNFITMAVGVDNAGQVTGVEVVTNEETPGLGAVAAENQQFLQQFNGKGPGELTLGVDVDGVSGASFTSKGITNGVNMALDMWNYINEGGP